MRVFTLTGQDIEISFQRLPDKLTAFGEALPRREATFTGEEITWLDSVNGFAMSVVLLDSTRDGSEIRLVVMFPVVRGESADHEITGAAIIVRDALNAITARPVRHSYEVHPLTGTWHG